MAPTTVYHWLPEKPMHHNNFKRTVFGLQFYKLLSDRIAYMMVEGYKTGLKDHDRSRRQTPNGKWEVQFFRQGIWFGQVKQSGVHVGLCQIPQNGAQNGGLDGIWQIHPTCPQMVQQTGNSGLVNGTTQTQAIGQWATPHGYGTPGGLAASSTFNPAANVFTPENIRSNIANSLVRSAQQANPKRGPSLNEQGSQNNTSVPNMSHGAAPGGIQLQQSDGSNGPISQDMALAPAPVTSRSNTPSSDCASEPDKERKICPDMPFSHCCPSIWGEQINEKIIQWALDNFVPQCRQYAEEGHRSGREHHLSIFDVPLEEGNRLIANANALERLFWPWTLRTLGRVCEGQQAIPVAQVSASAPIMLPGSRRTSESDPRPSGRLQPVLEGSEPEPLSPSNRPFRGSKFGAIGGGPRPTPDE